MGTIYDLKAFYRWLETASLKELAQRHDELLALLDRLTEQAVIKDARILLRKIEEEMLARNIRS